MKQGQPSHCGSVDGAGSFSIKGPHAARSGAEVLLVLAEAPAG